jgi:hypothetical protein
VACDGSRQACRRVARIGNTDQIVFALAAAAAIVGRDDPERGRRCWLGWSRRPVPMPRATTRGSCLHRANSHSGRRRGTRKNASPKGSRRYIRCMSTRRVQPARNSPKLPGSRGALRSGRCALAELRKRPTARARPPRRGPLSRRTWPANRGKATLRPSSAVPVHEVQTGGRRDRGAAYGSRRRIIVEGNAGATQSTETGRDPMPHK